MANRSQHFISFILWFQFIIRFYNRLKTLLQIISNNILISSNESNDKILFFSGLETGRRERALALAYGYLYIIFQTIDFPDMNVLNNETLFRFSWNI